jgi:replicative DNA helicase
MGYDPIDAVTPRDLGLVLDHALDRMGRRARGEERPVTLPWKSVAEKLGGGLWSGTLVALMGDMGSGKTQWALQASLHAAQAGVPVCYVGLSYGEDQIAARLFALKASKPWSDLYVGRDGKADLEDLRRRHATELKELPFHVVGAGTGRWSYANVRAIGVWMRARYPQNRPGSRPLMVVVDFLQLVAGSSRDEDTRDVMDRAIGEAQLVARDLDAVVLLISSTSRESDPRLQGDDSIGFRRDRRKDLILGRGNPAKLMRGKHPVELEQRCDTALVLSLESRDQGRSSRAWCAVAKNRAGSRAWCALRFDGSRFEEEEEGRSGDAAPEVDDLDDEALEPMAGAKSD